MKLIKKKKYLLILIGVVLIIVFACYLNNSEDNNELVVEDVTVDEITNIEEEILPVIQTLKVDIKGAVKSPGVYELEVGSRVVDLINKCGGLLDKADTSTINLSKVLSDEDVIIVYTKEEIQNYIDGNKVIEYIEADCDCPTVNDGCIDDIINEDLSESTEKSKININTASVTELMTLSGIGESKASDIIAYRENNKFLAIEDILNVSGIGEATYNKFKDFIEV
ncbi:MAG: ComEA family DNA-binding protein [Bacilli bacterium]|nr:ComEA family DNA-binding protein [Bacilli bacterium]